jgi:hypothetical protein
LDPDPPGGERKDNWVQWEDSKKWTTAGDHQGQGDGTNKQGLVPYGHKMPLPDGINSEDDRENEETSWVFRRNYTWSFISDGNNSNSWWSGTSWAYKNSRYANKPYNPPPGLGNIICAFNTFGQDKVFGYVDEGYNGMCLRGKKRIDIGGFGEVWSAARCKITFASPTTEDAWKVEREFITMIN